MTDPRKGFSAKEAVALAAGVLVVVAAAVITTLLRPIPLPYNFVLSLVLGAVGYLGALKILDPRTPRDRLEDEAAAEYWAMLGEMQTIAKRAAAAGHFASLSAPTAHQVLEIAAVVRSIANRYASAARDFTGVSTTLTALKQFDMILAYYLRIKSGRQFLTPAARAREISLTEGRTIPQLREALENLARQLDAGEVIEKNVSEDTLQSVLRSLNLADRSAADADASHTEREGLK